MSLATTVPNQPLMDEVRHSLTRAASYSLNRRHDDGHWRGEMMSNAAITAEYVMLRQALGLDMSVDREALISWFLSEQSDDGSWALAPESPGDISTTTEAYFALKLLRVSPDTPSMAKARRFVITAGGIAKVRMFTRVYLAIFGLFPWKSVPEMPAELILFPTAVPINIYRLASWARSTAVPLLIIRHHCPVYPLPDRHPSPASDFLDELWCSPANKLVPYTPPLCELLRTDLVAFTFALLDRVLHWLGGLRRFPFRSCARKKCIAWILQHQEPEGDWAGIFPPMHLGILALVLEGFGLDHPFICRGLEAIERFAWRDDKGKRIQPTVSPVWDTVLTTIGLCDAGQKVDLSASMRWIKAQQLLGPQGDWRVVRPRATPGGFSFEYFNRWYPDVDDTAAAILAMAKCDPDGIESPSVRRAAEWVLGMQNADGGWGAFDAENDALWLNKIPFSDMDALCDPSTADVTGRIVESFGLLMQRRDSAAGFELTTELVGRMRSAADRAIAYLVSIQGAKGAWFGRWGVNYIYGTSNVVCGLAYFLDEGAECISRAIEWLKSAQNHDGGWGESVMSYRDDQLAGHGPSSATQTAWALMALLAVLPAEDLSITEGVRYLLRTQTLSEHAGEASWPESLFTGTGFPKFFYLGYALYPHYFPMMALGRYSRAIQSSHSPNDCTGSDQVTRA